MNTRSAAPLIIVVVLAVGSIVGCSGGSEDFEASGTILMPSNNEETKSANGLGSLDSFKDLKAGQPCVPESGYGEFSDGAQVTIVSSTDEKIAFGETTDSVVSEESGAICEVTFEISGIPIQANEIYGLAAGNEQRGTLNVTKADLTSGVVLTLGG